MAVMAEQAGENPLGSHGGGRKTNIQDSQRILKQGETSEYLSRRIARDHPDVLTRTAISTGY